MPSLGLRRPPPLSIRMKPYSLRRWIAFAATLRAMLTSRAIVSSEGQATPPASRLNLSARYAATALSALRSLSWASARNSQASRASANGSDMGASDGRRRGWLFDRGDEMDFVARIRALVYEGISHL